jgi:GNAT superfamily N-acetyltransferase
MDLIETTRAGLNGALGIEVQALIGQAFPDTDANGNDDGHHGMPDSIMILRDGQQVVAHLALYRREVDIGDDAVEIGMVGSVAVRRDRQGRGLSRLLLANAHARLRERGIPFSILFACTPRVYLSIGYRLMANTTRFLDRDGTWKTLIYRGSMYAQLSARTWPDLPIDLRGPVV